MTWKPMSSMRVGKKVRCCNALVLNPRLSALRRRVSRSGGERIKVGRCEAKSLCPNAQTKTHVSTSLQSHFAAGGKHTLCPSCGVGAAKCVPTTRPVRPVRPTAAAPAGCKATCGNGTVGMQGPDTYTGVVQEWGAAPGHVCECRCSTQAGACPVKAAGARSR